MYAVIKSGGKQYKVKTGERIEIEKIIGNKGEQVNFSEVLFVEDIENNSFYLGSPFIKDYFVPGIIEETLRRKKVIIFKIKRRKNYRKKTGHRQFYTLVKIGDIKIPTNINKLELNS